jgi:DNA-binding NarL/FixJ family response regulator
LSQSERRVATLLLEGCDNREIGRRLQMELRTVKAHFSRMFCKLGIPSGGVKRVKLAVVLYREQLEAKK